MSIPTDVEYVSINTAAAPLLEVSTKTVRRSSLARIGKPAPKPLGADDLGARGSAKQTS